MATVRRWATLAWVGGMAWAGAASAKPPASTLEAGALFERGPVVLVEEDDAGRFRRATAMVVVDATPERVFEVLRDMGAWREFMPKVVRSEVIPHERGGGFDVRLVYDLPGPDTDYTARMEVDADAREIRGRWHQGDLRGSSWQWRVEGHGVAQSLLVHTLRVENFSPLLRQLDDDQQSMTVGLNVSSGLVTVKALKRRSEAGPTARR